MDPIVWLLVGAAAWWAFVRGVKELSFAVRGRPTPAFNEKYRDRKKPGKSKTAATVGSVAALMADEYRQKRAQGLPLRLKKHADKVELRTTKQADRHERRVKNYAERKARRDNPPVEPDVPQPKQPPILPNSPKPALPNSPATASAAGGKPAPTSGRNHMPLIHTATNGDIQSMDDYKAEMRSVVAEAQATVDAANADVRCAEADLDRLVAASEWLAAKKFDSETLADAQDMIDNAEKRLTAERDRSNDAQRRLETAEVALNNLLARHGRVQEAIADSPVQVADTDAYASN